MKDQKHPWQKQNFTRKQFALSVLVVLSYGLAVAQENVVSNCLSFAQGRTVLVASKTDYEPPLPRQRGTEFKIGCGSHNDDIMWGWQIELNDGSGFAFGGIASWTMQVVNGATQRVDDAKVHTKVLRDGTWITLTDELRKNNPMQKHHDALWNLRGPLQRITSRARHIYFEGRTEAAERQYVEKEIFPPAKTWLKQFNEVHSELVKSSTGNDAYCAGQIEKALALLKDVSVAVGAIGLRVTPEQLEALRLARVNLESAAELLDAEPPSRALSMPAYDEKTRSYIIFGGDHLDYLMNDVWVFDPQKIKWQQRHPGQTPEPRAGHYFMTNGDGRILMRGGYIYGRNPKPQGWSSAHYVHAGPGDWYYDVAKNIWTGPEGAETVAGNLRHYRSGNYLPNYFTAGERPDALAHEKILANLLVNTWVDLQPPLRFAGNRDWGTMGYDSERDMFYFYNGGHSAYGGTDVAHYHIAANRWDQLVEVELPLNYIGASGSSAPGMSFNRRPWITNHIWNSQRYHPLIKRLVTAGRYISPCFPREKGQPDPNTYLYDPDLGDWEKRVPNSAVMSCMEAQLLYVPDYGMIEWGRWRFNDETLDWEKIVAQGKLPSASIDFCGFAYDSKRKRVLFFSGGTYSGKPYSGEVFAMAIPSLEISSFTPDGTERFKDLYAGRENTLGRWILREVVYLPKLDMMLFSSNLVGGYSMALDLSNNRWVALKLPGPHPAGLSTSMAYDAKRDLVFSVGTRADVSVLRLDAKALKIVPVAIAADDAIKVAIELESGKK